MKDRLRDLGKWLFVIFCFLVGALAFNASQDQTFTGQLAQSYQKGQDWKDGLGQGALYLASATAKNLGNSIKTWWGEYQNQETVVAKQGTSPASAPPANSKPAPIPPPNNGRTVSIPALQDRRGNSIPAGSYQIMGSAHIGNISGNQGKNIVMSWQFLAGDNLVSTSNGQMGVRVLLPRQSFNFCNEQGDQDKNKRPYLTDSYINANGKKKTISGLGLCGT